MDICFTAAEGDSIRLAAGTHRYPFTFSLPPNVPSSFEGEYGYVHYTAESTIKRPSKTNHVTRSAFTVIGLVDLNLEPLEFRVSCRVCAQRLMYLTVLSQGNRAMPQLFFSV